MAGSNLAMLKRTATNKESDECYTPSNAILPLLEYLSRDKIYYDCTSGISSSIIDVLNELGYTCKSSGELDFLVDMLPNNIDIIITNPPYSKKDAFIQRCYFIGKPFALLLPVSSLQGQARGRLFQDRGIQLLVLNNRIDFTGKGAPHFGVAWFCYNLLPEKLIFRNAKEIL